MTQPIRSWIPYFVLSVALVLTAACTYYVANTSETRDSLRFQNAAQETQTIIEARLEEYVSILRAGHALFSSDSRVSAAEFHDFFQHLDLGERYRGIRGIGYSVTIAPDQIDSLTRAMRAGGVPSFHVWPDTPRAEYQSIIYVETVEPPYNVIAYGYDMLTDPVRRVAMERARDSAGAAATAIVPLLRTPDAKPQRGVLMYYPVYRGGGVPPTVEGRRSMLTGFIYAGFRVNEILNGVFESESHPGGVGFSLYDGSDTSAALLLYRSSTRVARSPRYIWTSHITLAGRIWTIVFASGPEFDVDTGEMYVPYIFLGGLLISFILFWLSRAQLLARIESERSNARLARSEERYRSIVETAPDVIFTVGADATITSLSPAFEVLAGWSVSEWLGKPFVPIVHPDDLPIAVLHFQDLLAGQTPAPYELRVLTKWGHYLDVEFRTQPHYEDGVIVGGIGIARDVTARRQGEQALRDSEARYRTFVEHSSEAIWRFELDEPIAIDMPAGEQLDCFYRWAYLAECNDVMARMYGFDNASEIVGARLGDMLVRTDPNNVAYLKAFIDAGYRLADAESVEVDRNGETKFFANNLIGIVEDGKLVRAWGTQRDITERRRAEAEVREAKEAAEAANRAKDQFLAVLSHELRTPLTPVLAALELLGDDSSLGAEACRMLELIDRNVKLEARLIDDLLDLTKIANGKLELNTELVDLNALVRAALDITGEDLRSKNLDVRVDLNAPHHVVQGDPARLEQVFWNLVKNAVKFTPDGGRISIRSVNDGPTIRIEVADTGIGIEPQLIPHIFNAFEQGEKTITRRFGGLGLGLAISKMLVELHGGAIAARSAGEGRGATFTVDLDTVDLDTVGGEPAGHG